MKSSGEYLNPENQSQVSMLTDIEDYRMLKPDWPRAIWCFNSKMSQVSYIYDWHFSINAKYGLSGSENDLQHGFYFSLLSTEGYFFTLYTIVVQSQKQNL